MSNVNLPAVVNHTSVALQQIADALGVSRQVLATDEEIHAAWAGLPRILQSIPLDFGSPLLARMCVATATGLFDSAVNYAWNTSVLALRQKIRDYGLNVVAEVRRSPFHEQALLDMRDADLLSLCVSLNLISEDGYFLLDQCRELRNSFSAAHPPIGVLDDHELLNFLNRCARYALSNTQNPTGIETREFITAIKAGRFSDDQLGVWVERLQNTHDAQRELLFGTLHAIYCDPMASEEARRNAVRVVKAFADELTPLIKSGFVDQHSTYVTKGDEDRAGASRTFFQELNLLGLLGEAERHSIVTAAARKLLDVHQSFDNFYNEPPFAERLLVISRQTGIPRTAQDVYVIAVVTCATGNPYGVSSAAYPSYIEMIKNFSPVEIATMLELPNSKTVVGHRLRLHTACQHKFRQLVRLLDAASVSTLSRQSYERWVNLS